MSEAERGNRTGRTQPGVRRALGMLLLPAALLTALLVGYVGVALGGAASEAAVRGALPYLIAVNHTLVFGVLLWVLGREGRTLADIGWRRGPGSLWREVALGLALALALYLVKELAFDSIRAVVAGAQPTFTTLFRFGLDVEELPLLAVATTFILVEESVYRGYGLPPLEARLGAPAALLVMGVLFGLLHWGNGLLAVVFTGLIGVALGAVFLWRRTLTAVVVAHAFYNALVILT